MTAHEFAGWATSDGLTGPDREMNTWSLCYIINVDPRQAKDALKELKSRLEHKSPKVQLLVLEALEALSKNCGDSVRGQIVDQDILHNMVKFVMEKRPDLKVKEKILLLIDAWHAFGGKYHAEYQKLRAAGVVFPPPTDAAMRASGTDGSQRPSLEKSLSLSRPSEIKKSVHNSTVGSAAPANPSHQGPSLEKSLSLSRPSEIKKSVHNSTVGSAAPANPSHQGPSLDRSLSLSPPRLPSEKKQVHNDSRSAVPANPSLTHSLSLRRPPRRNCSVLATS